jgi:hypothetical protein
MDAREERGLILEQETLGIVPVFWKDEEEVLSFGQDAAMGDGL